MSKIGTETPACYFERRWIDLFGPGLNRQYGFELHNRKMRYPRARAYLLKKTIHEVGAVLIVVPLCQRPPHFIQADSDLRTGLSELAAGLMLEPPVNRVIVTSPPRAVFGRN